jgi:hypothetical protein
LNWESISTILRDRSPGGRGTGNGRLDAPEVRESLRPFGTGNHQPHANRHGEGQHQPAGKEEKNSVSLKQKSELHPQKQEQTHEHRRANGHKGLAGSAPKGRASHGNGD